MTAATLERTVALVERVFPWNRAEAAEGLHAALAPHRHPAELLDRAAFDRACWVALAGGAVAGTVNLYREMGDYREALHLGWLAVAPEARRQGIGTRLLRHAIAEAEASGVAWLRLETSDAGDERLAQPLYDALGFAVVRTRASSAGRARWTTLWRERRLVT